MVAARLAGSQNRELASRFLEFLVSPEAQAVIPTTQWMYPVRDIGADLPASFAELVNVETPLAFTPEEVMAGRKDWVAEWRDGLTR